MASLWLIILMFTLMILGTPIVVAIGISCIIVIINFQIVPLSSIPQMVFSTTESFLLVAVPFFVLAGMLMESSKFSHRLVDFSNALVSWSKGGLGAVNIIASFIFGGISGSSLADTVALGSILIPRMVENGYSKEYAAAITVVSSTLAVVIPPSILMVVLGSIAQISIAKLLIGGIFPGALLTIIMLIQNYYVSKKRNYGLQEKFNHKILWKKTKSGWLAIGAPLIIIISILSGLVTPTEAAGLAVFYTLFISVFFIKGLTFKGFKNTIIEASKITSSVLLVVAVSKIFTLIISIDRIPNLISSFILSITDNKILILFIIVGIILLVGMLIDVMVAVIIFTPIFYPIIYQVGIDPIHFGVIFVMGLGIGLVTPPFGVCLFSVSNIAKISMQKLVYAVIPLYLSLIFSLVLVMIFPQIILFLPNLFLN